MALGKNGLLYAVVKAVLPQLGFMRYPIKFVVVAVFAVPLLAGYGGALEPGKPQLIRPKGEKLFRSLHSLLLGLLAVIVWD